MRRSFSDPPTEPPSRRQLDRVRSLAQLGDPETQTGRIVKEELVFLTRPDGIGFQEPWPLRLEEQATRPARAFDNSLIEGRLLGIKPVVPAQREQDMAAQGVQCGERKNGVQDRLRSLRVQGEQASLGAFYGVEPRLPISAIEGLSFSREPSASAGFRRPRRLPKAGFAGKGV